MTPRTSAYSRDRLRRMWAAVIVLLGTAITLAIVGVWLWPAALLAVPLLVLAWRETSDGGLLGPVPHAKGLAGERSVGEVLSTLGAEYQILADLDTGRGNVDHVVIGPTGVFAVETKNLAGSFQRRHQRVTVDGYDAGQILRQARAEALAIKDRLRTVGFDGWVEAVVASKGAVEGDRFQEGNVTVVHVSLLTDTIRNRRVRLSPGEVERAHGVLAGPDESFAGRASDG